MKPDIKRVETIAKRLEMSKEERDEFRTYIHERKREERGRNDYSFAELLQLGTEFLEEYRYTPGGD